MQYLQITRADLIQHGFSNPAQASSYFPANNSTDHIHLGVTTSYLDNNGQQHFAADDAYFLTFISIKKEDTTLVRLLHNLTTGSFQFPYNFNMSTVPPLWLVKLIDIGALIQADIEKQLTDETFLKAIVREQTPGLRTTNTPQKEGSAMMNFEEFLTAINHAVHGAADMVRNKNLALLNEYFVVSENPVPLSGNKNEEANPLTPKRTVFEYPVHTDDGPKIHTVQAPLISLVPCSQFQIKEVKVSSEMEIGVENNQLKLGVASGSGLGTKAKIEVVIESTNPVEGFVEVKSGYDRVLRAQIPG